MGDMKKIFDNWRLFKRLNEQSLPPLDPDTFDLEHEDDDEYISTPTEGPLAPERKRQRKDPLRRRKPAAPKEEPPAPPPPE